MSDLNANMNMWNSFDPNQDVYDDDRDHELEKSCDEGNSSLTGM